MSYFNNTPLNETTLFNKIEQLKKGARVELYIPWIDLYQAFLNSKYSEYLTFDYNIIFNAFVVTPKLLKPILDPEVRIPLIPVALELTKTQTGYDIDAVTSRALTKAISINTGLGLELWNDEWRNAFFPQFAKKEFNASNIQNPVQVATYAPNQFTQVTQSVGTIPQAPKPAFDPNNPTANMNPTTAEFYNAYMSLPLAPAGQSSEPWQVIKNTAWSMQKNGQTIEQIINWIYNVVKFRAPFIKNSTFNNVQPQEVAKPKVEEDLDNAYWNLEF